MRHTVAASFFAAAMVTAGLSACGSSHPSSTTVGGQLAARVLPPPDGYQLDSSSSDEAGTITPAVFDQFGGIGSPTRSGFVAGYRQNYVDYSTEEGLSITLLEFSSASDAATYLRRTAPETLSAAAPTRKPFSLIPEAVEVDGTKGYGGDYSHAMLMSKGPVYAQFVYATSGPEPLPTEFYTWSRVQYSLLR